MAKRNSAPAPPRRHSLVWLQGLLCGGMVTLATPTSLLIGVLLGPALLAIVFDRESGRARARCIALCSMAAAVAPLRVLWTSGHSMALAMALAGDLRIVATAWVAAAGGWLLAELMPIGVRTVLDAVSLARAAKLRSERVRLIEAWSAGESGGSEPPNGR